MATEQTSFIVPIYYFLISLIKPYPIIVTKLNVLLNVLSNLHIVHILQRFIHLAQFNFFTLLFIYIELTM